MNDVLSDADVARIYSRNSSGYSLISYHPAAVRVYRLLVRVLKIVRSDLPLLDEFVLRSISAGLTTRDDISAVLGLDVPIVERSLLGLQNEGLVYLGATEATRSHSLILTPRGTEVLYKKKIEHPVQDNVWVEMDGLTGAVSMVSPWRPKTSEVVANGYVAIDPLPRLTLTIEEIKQRRLINEAWKKTDQLFALVDVLEVVKREPCFRDDCMILAFKMKGSNAIRYDLVVDGQLSEDHGKAFRARLARHADAQFPLSIGPRDGVNINAIRELPDVALSTQEKELTEAKEIIERRAEEILVTISETLDADVIQRLTEELAAAQVERDRLNTQIDSQVVKHLTVFDHPKYLRRAMENCKERLLIIAPWVNPVIVNSLFLEHLEQALTRGVHVYIGYGISEYSDSGNDPDTVAELKRRSRNHTNFTFVRLGDTHSKVLICDREFAITGSFNWLSFAGDPNWKPRDEQSWYIGIPERIEEQFQYNVKRLQAATPT